MESDLINSSIAKSIFQKHKGCVNCIEIITESRNFIYKVTSEQKLYVIKIFTNQQVNPLGNIELFANEWLKDLTPVSCCVAKGSHKISGYEYRFMIFDFVKGPTLLDKIQESQNFQPIWRNKPSNSLLVASK